MKLASHFKNRALIFLWQYWINLTLIYRFRGYKYMSTVHSQNDPHPTFCQRYCQTIWWAGRKYSLIRSILINKSVCHFFSYILKGHHQRRKLFIDLFVMLSLWKVDIKMADATLQFIMTDQVRLYSRNSVNNNQFLANFLRI